MAAPSPQLTRLDTILSLVREQEEHRREQDLRIASLSHRLSEWEGRSAEEWAPLWALKVSPARRYCTTLRTPRQ
jgi:hypothetical protein